MKEYTVKVEVIDKSGAAVLRAELPADSRDLIPEAHDNPALLMVGRFLADSAYALPEF